MHKIESSLLNFYQKYTLNSDNSCEKSKALSIAYSGGLDSSVLLFASKQLLNNNLVEKIQALHVNHGIENESDSWQSHCESVCEKLSIKILCKKLNLLTFSHKINENIARNARYEFFKSKVEQGSLIAFAHHRDDQVETLLFRLFRGTGIAGAGAIPQTRKLGNARVIRPFLNISKNELVEYAEKNNLSWIDDPSNHRNQYSRNIIRNNILPIIQKTWPKVFDSLNSFTHIAREQNSILQEVAESDLLGHSLENKRQLYLSKFIKLSNARQKNLLHYWTASVSENEFSRATYQESEELLKQLNNLLLGKHADSTKQSKLNVKLGNHRIRLYDEKLWLCSDLEPVKLDKIIDWNDIANSINIFNNRKIFVVNSHASTDKSELLIRAPRDNELVKIRPRVGGEKLKPHYRDKTCDLKKIYQELNLPYWVREWLPIIYYNNQIACVPGVFVNRNLLAKSTDTAIEFFLTK
ncbi:MAG: tRNA(Ile)-lysidine synthase [Polaribacter sp.]|jgi:tRNA(Ile)-lysidine synthase